MMLIPILLNHYMFNEVVRYLHVISGLEANIVHVRTLCFAYKAKQAFFITFCYIALFL